MRPIHSMIAVLCALAAAGAPAQSQPQPQTQAPAQTREARPPTGKPVPDGPSYGPVLETPALPATTRRPAPASTQPIVDASPQAQEERSGMPPSSTKPLEVDPSARAAPQTVRPQAESQTLWERQPPRTRQEIKEDVRRREQQDRSGRQAGDKDKQARRRAGAAQRIEAAPRIAAPVPALPRPVQAVPAPLPAGPQSSQAVGCLGSSCTDVSGTRFNAGGAGQVGVSTDGRLCTVNGANVQCL